MADPVDPNDPGAGGGGGDGDEMVSVKKADYDKLNSDHAAIAGRHQTNVNVIRDLKAENDRLTTDLASKAAGGGGSDPEKHTQAAKITELQERVKRSEDREERSRKSATRDGIIRGLTKNKATPELAVLAADSILANNGGSIKAIDNNSGSYDIIFEDITGEKKPIADFTKAYMESESGKLLLAPKKNVSGVGNLDTGGAGGGELKRISTSDWQKLPVEERNAGRFELIPD